MALHASQLAQGCSLSGIRTRTLHPLKPITTTHTRITIPFYRDVKFKYVNSRTFNKTFYIQPVRSKLARTIVPIDDYRWRY